MADDKKDVTIEAIDAVFLFMKKNFLRKDKSNIVMHLPNGDALQYIPCVITKKNKDKEPA